MYFDGKVVKLDDYKSVTFVADKGAKTIKSNSTQKGQFEELEALALALRSGAQWPITLEEQLSATEISFKVEELINSGQKI
ncbi:MAG: hypothetical protein EOO39_01485 [Cytophagaceae bacterium]|nr:MAG: hypothetical protein EOO39_01485 [Cytophagaceae bacterium]